MLLDLMLNVDKYLGIFIQEYGILTYLILFAIILIETGLVIMPFLPGDSLLFVAGVFAATGVMDVYTLIIILSLAAIFGDSLNYWIGNFFGMRILSKTKIFKKEHLEKTKEFYKKHGSMTIVIARFIPIIRTFAPFVAGIGKMNYKKFLTYNILGGILWVLIFVMAGYWFGAIPIIKDNLMLIIYSIIIVSMIPPIIGVFRQPVLKNKKKGILNTLTFNELKKRIL